MSPGSRQRGRGRGRNIRPAVLLALVTIIIALMADAILWDFLDLSNATSGFLRIMRPSPVIGTAIVVTVFWTFVLMARFGLARPWK